MSMTILIYIVVLIFSVVIHEVAHGYVAYLRGDDTAKMSGRLTLNPIPHIDLFGTIVLPGVLILMNAPILFGWAKPVPINTYRLKNPKADIPLVSLAGPLSNVLLAVSAGIGIRLIKAYPDFAAGFGASIQTFLYVMVMVNVVLLVINLIPVPPLDGSKVITYFLPEELAIRYLNINPYIGFIILLALLYSGIIWKIAGPVVNFFMKLILG
ncbi:MAG: site-2 protease family protein [Endomicrobia bacterium]|nr:site-2 protease family protein [Endomicrobiia bacterium]MCL2506530.1 site-2 protease family protein [Endomicrobiia bacterium]